MTPTNRLPASEALGEALAALNGCREKFREGEMTFSLLRADYLHDASQAIQHLANSGWTLTPGPTVNAGEEVAWLNADRVERQIADLNKDYVP